MIIKARLHVRPITVSEYTLHSHRADLHNVGAFPLSFSMAHLSGRKSAMSRSLSIMRFHMALRRLKTHQLSSGKKKATLFYVRDEAVTPVIGLCTV